jgi:hypothetical protein
MMQLSKLDGVLIQLQDSHRQDRRAQSRTILMSADTLHQPLLATVERFFRRWILNMV